MRPPWWAWLLGLGGAALVIPRVAKGKGPAAPSPEDREGWVQMQDAPGLAVREPSRSWTSPAVRSVLLAAGQVAKQLGGKLQLADVGPEIRGDNYPPHKSHRWGRDADIAYTLDDYPTPDDVPVDERVVAVLEAIAPHVEVVGVNAVRLEPFEGRSFKASAWEGHAHHLHLRLRPELVSTTATT